nr:protein CEBPZOS [Biomphalaria glabrata]
MLKKPRQTTLFQKFGLALKIVFGLEVAAVIGSYFIWNRMNHDQDFRYKVYKMSPLALHYYYKIPEMLGGQSTRSVDYSAWGVDK